MLIPAAFNKLCSQFHAGMHLSPGGADGAIRAAIMLLNAPERAVAKSFVTQLLRSNLSIDELQNIWWKTPADVYFPDDSIVGFLSRLADLLGDPSIASLRR